MKYLLVFIIVFTLTSFSQQRFIVSPANETIPIKSGESSIEVAKGAGILSASNYSRGYNPQLIPPELEFPTYHKMVVGMWFTAPATGTLDSIFWMGGECGAIESLVYVRTHNSLVGPDWGPGVPPYPPACQPWGYFINTNDKDNGIAAFEWDASDYPPVWISTINEYQNGQVVPKTRPPFSWEIWGEGSGYGIVQRRGVNKLGIMITGIPCSLYVGDKFFVSLRTNHSNAHGNDLGKPTTFPASVTNAPYPSRAWVFYEHPGESYGYTDPFGLQMPCGGVDPAPKGWIAMGGPNCEDEAMVFNWWYKMSVSTDVPPTVIQYDKLGHTFSTSLRTVTAEITDSNPSNPGDAGVASAYLVYSIDNNSEDSIAMIKTTGDVWTADLPGAAEGSEILYHISAIDINGNRTSDYYNKYKVLALANANTLYLL